jgi:putative iron-only hydrogenase system regulator
MGIPHRERQVGVLSLIVDGAEDEINTLTGRLGNINGVSAKATMAKKS